MMANKSKPENFALRSQAISSLSELHRPIVSYAQNLEDVILWRALGHIENGFYIDIGAQHPTEDSVSKAFYDAGWKGVHIVANPHYAEMLREERIGDTVLETAIGRSEGTLDFYTIDGTGSSTGDPDIAEMHRKAGRKVVECSVPMTTLKQVLADVGQPDIHWLKIDVEGMEGEVLAGWGDSKIRPWVLVVETVAVGESKSLIEKWKSLILKKGYTLALDDGNNLYYISKNQSNIIINKYYKHNFLNSIKKIKYKIYFNFPIFKKFKTAFFIIFFDAGKILPLIKINLIKIKEKFIIILNRNFLYRYLLKYHKLKSKNKKEMRLIKEIEKYLDKNTKEF